MRTELYYDNFSEGFSFFAALDMNNVLHNLQVLGRIDPENPQDDPIFAAGRVICSLEVHENQEDLKMYFFDPELDPHLGDSALGSYSSDEHKQLLLDVFNEIKSSSDAVKNKYVLKFHPL